MINTLTLNKMYELFIDNEYITKKDLETCGFDFLDILNLLKKGHIKAVGDSKFILLEVDDLYRYGIRLSQIDKVRANKCFEKCFKLDSNYQKTLVSLFYNCIINDDLIHALYYIDLMKKTNKLEYINDSNFYLYLLNNIYELPDNYKEIVRKLTFNDIKIEEDDIRYGNIGMLNNARVMAFEKNFFYSIRLVRDATEDGTFTFYDKVIKTLLSQAGDAEVARRYQLQELIKLKKYEEALKFLKNKEQNFGLSDYDIYIIKLIQEIQQIETTLSIPEKDIVDTKKIFDAIDNKNYKYALSLYEKQHKNIENPLYMILFNLCETINGVTAYNYIFKIIKKFFDELDYKNLLKSIRNYLNLTNSLEYEFLVITHIKLDLYKNENNLDNTKHLLYKIHNGTFKFDVDLYIKKFNEAISESNLNEAKIYLDIISKYAIEYDISYLKTKLDNKPITNLDNGCVQVSAFDKSIGDYKESNLEKRIDEIYSYLIVNKGIIILDYLSYEQRQVIYNIVKTYPDLEIKSLGEGEVKKLYLRYKLRNEDIINYKLLKKCANTAFEKQQYDISISYGLQLLQYGNPDASIYSRIGFAYLHLNNPDMAYPYLLVAYDLEKNDKLRNEYAKHLQNISSFADVNVFDLEVEFEQNAFCTHKNVSILNDGFNNKTSKQNFISKLLVKIRRK